MNRYPSVMWEANHHDLTRLPKWVQSMVGRMERRIASLEDELASENDVTSVWVENTLTRPRIYLPDSTAVTFAIKGSEIRVTAIERGIDVLASKHPSHLLVRPSGGVNHLQVITEGGRP